MNKLGKYFWAGFFLFIFIIFLGALRVTKPRVLILSSYGKDNQISQYVKSGVDESIAVNRIPIKFITHYMGINNTSNSQQVTKKGKEALSFINHFDPDVIIAVGFDANKLVAESISSLNAGVQIVPVAIDSNIQDVGYPKNANVIGVIRRLPYLGIADFLSETMRNHKVTISVVGADTPSNQVRVQLLLRDHPENMEIKTTLLSNCFNDWKKLIDAQDSKTDGLLVLPTQSLKEDCGIGPTLLNADQFVSWVEANSTPLPIGLDGAFVMNGGAVSFYPSYQEEGALAMNLALTLLKSKNRAEIPTSYSDSYQIALKKEHFDKRNLYVPNVYLQYGAKSGLNYRDSE